MPQDTLAWTLRYKLGLTGSKLGCDRAECGACTVLIDDVPRYSCSVLAHTVRGKKIVTVEGLAKCGADQKQLHPVQAAMVEQYGSQCGYCTPGFVVSLFEAYYRDGCREPWQISDQLCGNLCRCSGYRSGRTASSRRLRIRG